MNERGVPQHIETIREAEFYIWHVIGAEGLVDLRLADIVDGQLTDKDFGSVMTVEVNKFPDEQQEHLLRCGTGLFDRGGAGLLHVLKITYSDGEQEEIEMYSLRPYIPPQPPTDEQVAERDAWVKMVRSKALSKIPEDQ